MKPFYTLILFVVCSLISFWLLQEGHIESSDFILLIALSIVVSVLFPNFDDIQELSIGGNKVVRLREAKEELQVTIEALRNVKKSTFRMLLLKSLSNSGGFGSGHLVDERTKYFFSLIDEIKEAECFEVLKEDIEIPLKVLLKQQLDNFYRFFYNTSFNGEDFPEPMYFHIELNDDVVEKVHQGATPQKTLSDKKEELLRAIDTYAKLYLIWGEIGKCG